MPSKRIAIIGSGIAGLTCAHQLTPYFDVTLFEKNEYLEGTLKPMMWSWVTSTSRWTRDLLCSTIGLILDLCRS